VAENMYDNLIVGDQFSRSITLTEAHLLLGNMLFADSVPLHVDQLTGEQSAYGSRIMPGPVVAGLAAVTLGMNLKGSAIGYLEQRRDVDRVEKRTEGEVSGRRRNFRRKLRKSKQRSGVGMPWRGHYYESGAPVAS
jgi:hypothetical protein